MALTDPTYLDNLDFSCEAMRPAVPVRETGRLQRAGEQTHLIRLPGGKVIGKSHSADVAAARAAEVGGTIQRVR